MLEKQNYAQIKQNITDAPTQRGTGSEGVAEGREFLVQTKTTKHPLDVNLLAAILRNNKRMTYAGADIAIQAHYDEAMEMLYGDDDRCERHPYFSNRSASDWTPEAK